MRDWEVWKSLKIQDFKSFMLEHIDNQIQSNQQVSLFRLSSSSSSYFLTVFDYQMLQNWTKLLPVLEGAGVP